MKDERADRCATRAATLPPGNGERGVAVAMRDLDFSYDSMPVLTGVTADVLAGDFVGIVGPNGGGKTTLLRLVLGLLQPTSGCIRVWGEAPERSRRRIGYVPQSAKHDPQFPVTALDVVLMGRLGAGAVFGPYRACERQEAMAALESVGMADQGRRPFSALSGGQRQRVLVARALATQPDMLLLDEPTASLDAGAEREVYELLSELNRRLTVVLVTHDLTFVSSAVHSVLCVNRHVTYHPTCDLTDVTGDLLREMFGEDRRVVRHDVHCQEGEQCL